MKAKEKQDYSREARKKLEAKGKCPLSFGAMTEDALAEASEGCCSADFATHSLYWQWSSLLPHIAISVYHFTLLLKKKMQISAIFYHFAPISSHILIGSHRQKSSPYLSFLLSRRKPFQYTQHYTRRKTLPYVKSYIKRNS